MKHSLRRQQEHDEIKPSSANGRLPKELRVSLIPYNYEEYIGGKILPHVPYPFTVDENWPAVVEKLEIEADRLNRRGNILVVGAGPFFSFADRLMKLLGPSASIVFLDRNLATLKAIQGLLKIFEFSDSPTEAFEYTEEFIEVAFGEDDQLKDLIADAFHRERMVLGRDYHWSFRTIEGFQSIRSAIMQLQKQGRILFRESDLTSEFVDLDYLTFRYLFLSNVKDWLLVAPGSRRLYLLFHKWFPRPWEAVAEIRRFHANIEKLAEEDAVIVASRLPSLRARVLSLEEYRRWRPF